jgi:hypothetical protein
MGLRRLYVLLVVWCVLALAPGALVALGVFGHMDANSTITGRVLLLWTAGYLAQLAMFMWIMNIVGKQKILWWIVASTLPWALDWTLPVSSLLVLLWFPITVAVAGWIALVARREESLRQHGIRATGVVLEVLKPRMNVVINNVYIKREVRLRIEREDGTPAYEAVWDGLFMLGAIPSPGDRIPLLVDPANPQRLDYEKREVSRGAAPVQHAASRTTGGESITDELKKLTDLRDRGAITESEFKAAKKKLLF